MAPLARRPAPPQAPFDHYRCEHVCTVTALRCLLIPHPGPAEPDGSLHFMADEAVLARAARPPAPRPAPVPGPFDPSTDDLWRF